MPICQGTNLALVTKLLSAVRKMTYLYIVNLSNQEGSGREDR
jgi:hypothetical protein